MTVAGGGVGRCLAVSSARTRTKVHIRYPIERELLVQHTRSAELERGILERISGIVSFAIRGTF
jgi:hypothetical protein